MSAARSESDSQIFFRRDVLFYAEDDIAFAELLQKNLQTAGFNHAVIHVPDGEQALLYLKGHGKYADRSRYPLPAVALLDLKMPRVDGFEILRWIRQESPFPYLPVIVLTVSEELRDVNQAYKLGANSFLIKPPTPSELKEMMRSMDQFWFKQNVSDQWRTSRDERR